MEGDQLVVVPNVEIKSAKANASLPVGDFTLAVHPAEQFEVECAEFGASYVFVPDKGDPFFSLLLSKAADSSIALVGMLSLSQNGQAKLYRLRNVEGRLILREALLPNQTQMLVPTYCQAPKAKESALFDALVEAVIVDFDPGAYTDDRLIAVRKVLEKAANGKSAPVKKGARSKTTEESSDLESQLEAALAAQKAS
jgi:non-homologous end joining protein Ku